MHPLMMAALISGGVNALQGKRGSDLLKSTVRDTAIAAALGGMNTGGSDAGISSFASKGSSSQILPSSPSKTAMMKGALQPELYGTPTPKPGYGSKLESAFSAIEKPFRDPKTGDISKFRVGLGAAGLGGTAYAAGLFDPKPAPDPKYPGYNRFYAADPEMFQPFSGKEIDYSKYPEGSPYSGMQEGGEVMMSPDDEMLQFDMQQQSMADGPGIVGYLKERFDESFTRDPAPGKAMRSMMKRSPKETISIEESITAIPMSKKMSDVSPVELMQKFMADPDKTAIEVAVMQSDKDRVTVADVQRAKDLLQRMAEQQSEEDAPSQRRRGIGSLLEETDIRIPEAEDAPAQVQELMDTFRSRASNEPTTNQFNKGDLVDVLPSKLKRDENDEKNYKRTSGKMVTDETGKGSGNKDTMLAQLADGEFVTKAKSVLGAGKAMGGKSKAEQRKLGAQFFYKQMADLEKLAEAR